MKNEEGVNPPQAGAKLGALDFDCEKCGRPAGAPCVNADGRIPNSCHRARIVAWRVRAALDLTKTPALPAQPDEQES
jgi:hypothetical protein